MARQGNEQALVNAIIDGEQEVKELANEASALGVALAGRLTLIAKNVLQGLVNGKVTKQKALQDFTKLYRALVLAGFVDVAQPSLALARKTNEAVLKAAAALGPGVKAVGAIKSIDKKQRANEKAGLGGGPTETTS